MDYEKKYKEALERARIWQNHLYDTNDKDYANELNYIFPELAESGDEKIRKQILSFLKEFEYDHYRNLDFSAWIAWLEKQGKQKPTLPKWKYKNDNTPLLRDSLILNKYGCVAKSPSGAFVNDVWVIDYDELAKLPKEELEKQGEQETLCDKCRKEHPSHSCQDITELGRCSVEHEQETDNSYCQENCKGFQETGKCFADGDCKAKREAESNDKNEPKFHEGDWVIDKQGIVHQIANVVENVTCHTYGYDIVGGGYFNDNTEGVRLWTIQDAKDGDVLLFEGFYNSIVLFQGIGINGKGRINYHCKCDLMNYSFGVQGDFACLGTIEKDAEHYHPATKEQRDLLFQKMKEAEYIFDFKNKELKKIKNDIEIPFGAKDSELQEATYFIPKGFHAEIDGDKIIIKKGEKPTAWSEDDERNMQNIDSVLFYDKTLPEDTCIKLRDFLKSLKQRIGG